MSTATSPRVAKTGVGGRLRDVSAYGGNRYNTSYSPDNVRKVMTFNKAVLEGLGDYEAAHCLPPVVVDTWQSPIEWTSVGREAASTKPCGAEWGTLVDFYKELFACQVKGSTETATKLS